MANCPAERGTPRGSPDARHACHCPTRFLSAPAPVPGQCLRRDRKDLGTRHRRTLGAVLRAEGEPSDAQGHRGKGWRWCTGLRTAAVAAVSTTFDAQALLQNREAVVQGNCRPALPCHARVSLRLSPTSIAGRSTMGRALSTPSALLRSKLAGCVIPCLSTHDFGRQSASVCCPSSSGRHLPTAAQGSSLRRTPSPSR